MQLHVEKYVGHIQNRELHNKSGWSIIKTFLKNSKHPHNYFHSKVRDLGKKQWEAKRMQA